MQDDDVKGEEEDDVENDDVEEEERMILRMLMRRMEGPSQDRAACFMRACAVEMQVNISQEPIYREIYGEKVRAQSEHPDQAPAFTTTVRTPQCGNAFWGMKPWRSPKWNHEETLNETLKKP